LVKSFNKDWEITERSRANTGPEVDALQKKTDLELRQQEAKKLAEQGFGEPSESIHRVRPKRTVVLVNLHYKLSSSISSVPLFGKTVRFMVESNNTYSSTAISLKPYANEMTFPVVVSEMNDDSYLRLNTYSLLPAAGTIEITRAQWTVLDTTDANLKLFTD
jgi:hypothetical protein